MYIYIFFFTKCSKFKFWSGPNLISLKGGWGWQRRIVKNPWRKFHNPVIFSENFPSGTKFWRPGSHPVILFSLAAYFFYLNIIKFITIFNSSYSKFSNFQGALPPNPHGYVVSRPCHRQSPKQISHFLKKTKQIGQFWENHLAKVKFNVGRSARTFRETCGNNITYKFCLFFFFLV